MKDKSPNLQMDSMISHYIHSQDKGVTQPSLKELASRFSFNPSIEANSEGLMFFSNQPPRDFIEYSPSDVSFLASVSHDNFEYTQQPINLEQPIKEG